jgi:hypothetical protein
MPAIKRYILLNYSGENYEYWRVATSDKSALLMAVRQLEIDLGKMPGSLRKHFLQGDRNNWEIKIC